MPEVSTRVEVTNPENVERVILDPELFLKSLPGARILDPTELIVEVKFPIFLFSTKDQYKVVLRTERNSYLYHLKGNKSEVKLYVRPLGKIIELNVQYSGRFGRLVGFEFKKFGENLAMNLEKQIDSLPRISLRKKGEEVFEIDFEDPEDFKRKFYRFLLVGTDELLVSEGGLIDLLNDILSEMGGSGTYYVSGVSPDGSKRFQVVIQDGKLTSARFSEGNESMTAVLSRNPGELESVVAKVDGDFVVNVWKKLEVVG